jgi:phage terminase large subunit-like protein
VTWAAIRPADVTVTRTGNTGSAIYQERPGVDPVCRYELDGTRCRKRGPHRCAGRVRHVLAFFAELLTHTKGDWARHPFIPSPWQREEVLAPLFGEVVYDEERGRYVRRYRVLYLFIPRKNGKTELLAGVVLYLLCADGETAAEVYGLALDRDQAGLIYRAARAMVRNSEVLKERLAVVSSAGRITDELTGSLYAILAGDAEGALGVDPSAAVIDELLTQPSRELYDAIRTGFGARAQPLMLMATTAENDPTGFAATEREWSERVLADPALEPERLVVMYAAPDGADWAAPSTWRAANPALGDFLDLRTLAAECRLAQGNPAAERAFKQFRLNIPVGKIGRAIDMAAWDASAGPLRVEALTAQLARRTCYAGLDLASTSDLAAYVLDFPDGRGGHDILFRHFAPAAALRELSRRTGGQADAWVARGLLTLTEGNVIDYGAITAALAADRAVFGITDVAFDRWGATQLSTDLVDDGWPLVQMGQGFASMAAPTREFLRLVKGGGYRHGGNPVARWEASNAVTRTDPSGNLKLDKARSADKIDGLVAGVMALDRALRHAGETEDYEAAGF